MVLNKKALENLIVDLAEVQNVEIKGEFLILRWEDGERERVVGVYIHPDKEDTREVNCGIIMERWEGLINGSIGGLGNTSDGGAFEENNGQFAGRKLDVNQLFAQQRIR